MKRRIRTLRSVPTLSSAMVLPSPICTTHSLSTRTNDPPPGTTISLKAGIARPLMASIVTFLLQSHKNMTVLQKDDCLLSISGRGGSIELHEVPLEEFAHLFGRGRHGRGAIRES